jgi:hypothetical protein
MFTRIFQVENSRKALHWVFASNETEALALAFLSRHVRRIDSARVSDQTAVLDDPKHPWFRSTEQALASRERGLAVYDITGWNIGEKIYPIRAVIPDRSPSEE